MYYSSVFNGTISTVRQYYTNNSLDGNLTITRFDQVNQIVAGTFSFTAVSENKDTVRVTNGRVDMHYTR